jgi:uncharacterized protein YecT (DUF1311 family)
MCVVRDGISPVSFSAKIFAACGHVSTIRSRLRWVRRHGAMTSRVLGFAFFLCLPIAAWGPSAGAQNGKQQRIAEVAYETEMAHQPGACPEAQTVADRDVCLNNAKVETYQNYKTFFDALREALIESSADDANALALDRTEQPFEKYRVTACDAMVRTYDMGTIKHPGSSEPSAQTRCLILLTRSRMRDLKELYAATL